MVRRESAATRQNPQVDGTSYLKCFGEASAVTLRAAKAADNVGCVPPQPALFGHAMRSPVSGDLLLSLAALSIPARLPFSVIFKRSPSGSSRMAGPALRGGIGAAVGASRPRGPRPFGRRPVARIDTHVGEMHMAVDYRKITGWPPTQPHRRRGARHPVLARGARVSDRGGTAGSPASARSRGQPE